MPNVATHQAIANTYERAKATVQRVATSEFEYSLTLVRTSLNIGKV